MSPPDFILKNAQGNACSFHALLIVALLLHIKDLVLSFCKRRVNKFLRCIGLTAVKDFFKNRYRFLRREISESVTSKTVSDNKAQFSVIINKCPP